MEKFELPKNKKSFPFLRSFFFLRAGDFLRCVPCSGHASRKGMFLDKLAVLYIVLLRFTMLAIKPRRNEPYVNQWLYSVLFDFSIGKDIGYYFIIIEIDIAKPAVNGQSQPNSTRSVAYRNLQLKFPKVLLLVFLALFLAFLRKP